MVNTKMVENKNRS